MSDFEPRRYTAADAERQAEMLGNRIKKNLRRMAKDFERKNWGAYRIYDWDIPEIRVVVDWYEGHLVVAEYERDQTRSVPDYLDRMAASAAASAGVSMEQVVTKCRRTRPGDGDRYQKLAMDGERLKVREGEFRFLVNLTDFIDTGLFSHHRITRQLLRDAAEGGDFLNLYGYTGAFTCAAAAGGAKSTTTVDASGRYLDWASDNLELNGFAYGEHEMVRSDCREYLDETAERGKLFDLCMLDPPSFSDHFGSFDVLRDHPGLIRQALAVMSPGGWLWFSTNHAQFEPRLDDLPVDHLEELTGQTTPPDFRRVPHRLWRMQVR